MLFLQVALVLHELLLLLEVLFVLLGEILFVLSLFLLHYEFLGLIVLIFTSLLVMCDVGFVLNPLFLELSHDLLSKDAHMLLDS